MSNVGPRSNTALLDEPKTRIAVATAVAFGLWCAALVLVGELLVTPEVTAPPPPNLDAQLVEIEPPPAPRASTPAQATPAHAAPPANVVHATPPPVHRATPVHEEPSQHAAKPALAPARPPVTPAAPSTTPSPVCCAFRAGGICHAIGQRRQSPDDHDRRRGQWQRSYWCARSRSHCRKFRTTYAKPRITPLRLRASRFTRTAPSTSNSCSRRNSRV